MLLLIIDPHSFQPGHFFFSKCKEHICLLKYLVIRVHSKFWMWSYLQATKITHKYKHVKLSQLFIAHIGFHPTCINEQNVTHHLVFRDLNILLYFLAVWRNIFLLKKFEENTFLFLLFDFKWTTCSSIEHILFWGICKRYQRQSHFFPLFFGV